MKTKPKKAKVSEPGFYDGVLCALELLAMHDQPTIAKEIANSVGVRQLKAAAVDEYDKETLRRLGILRAARKR